MPHDNRQEHSIRLGAWLEQTFSAPCSWQQNLSDMIPSPKKLTIEGNLRIEWLCPLLATKVRILQVIPDFLTISPQPLRILLGIKRQVKMWKYYFVYCSMETLHMMSYMFILLRMVIIKISYPPIISTVFEKVSPTTPVSERRSIVYGPKKKRLGCSLATNSPFAPPQTSFFWQVVLVRLPEGKVLRIYK